MINNDIQERIDYLFYLHAEIAAGRAKLQSLWDGQGIIDHVILSSSRELDKLIYAYYRATLPIYKAEPRLRKIKQKPHKRG